MAKRHVAKQGVMGGRSSIGGGMGGEDKEYEAFRIFEQIAEEAGGRRVAEKLDAPFSASTDSAPYYESHSFHSRDGHPTVSNRDDGSIYYEIEYDSSPLPGAGNYVPKSDRIQPRERDAVRERFDQMREIARESRCLSFSSSKFFDERTRKENARVFYLQGMYMKDFEDTYEKVVPYSAYFPSYQMMGYEQLRTYFTWRTLVRQGMIPHISLSYAYLYLYELLNNIGTEGPQDALERLMFFWEVYRVYDASVDKYVLKWLKDYHIYYELPWSFREFTEEYGLTEHYPGLADPKDDFTLFCSISKYDIRKSAFYLGGSLSEGNSFEENVQGDSAREKRMPEESFSGTKRIDKIRTKKENVEKSPSGKEKSTDRERFIRDCFSFTMDRLRQIFGEKHIKLDESIFQPTKSRSVWMPFREALFYPAVKQRDRQIIFSEKESYQCVQSNWTHSTAITSESGKRLIGYVMKQMEAVLRKLTNYKYKLSANLSMLSDVTREELAEEGISLEKAVTDAVTDFYREATKTVIRIDADALERIRRDAMVTQEKLIVAQEEGQSAGIESQEGRESSASIAAPQTGVECGTDTSESTRTHSAPEQEKLRSQNFTKGNAFSGALQKNSMGVTASPSTQKELREAPQEALRLREATEGDSGSREALQETFSLWDTLRRELTETELSALQLLVESSSGTRDIKSFADEHGVMLEVLVDGINEKAADMVGDSLLDGEFMIYEDYIEQVKEMVGLI